MVIFCVFYALFILAFLLLALFFYLVINPGLILWSCLFFLFDLFFVEILDLSSEARKSHVGLLVRGMWCNQHPLNVNKNKIQRLAVCFFELVSNSHTIPHTQVKLNKASSTLVLRPKQRFQFWHLVKLPNKVFDRAKLVTWSKLEGWRYFPLRCRPPPSFLQWTSVDHITVLHLLSDEWQMKCLEWQQSCSSDDFKSLRECYWL